MSEDTMQNTTDTAAHALAHLAAPGEHHAAPTRNPFAAATLTTTSSIQPMQQASTAPKSHVSGVGKWVFDHKKSFSQDNPLAWYGIRNILNNMVAILGLLVAIVPVRAGMGKIAQLAHGKEGEIVGGVRKAIENGFGNPTLQNMAGVGVSFSTFRTMYKAWQRSYDRVFGDPKSAEEATQAIADLPKNIWKDIKQIAPVEFPATMTAAVALVGIRNAVNGGPPSLPENHWRDVAGCAFLAYPVFFEMTERLGRDWQLLRGYKDPKTNEHINKDKMTMGEFLTRQVPGIAAGIIPYIGFNNLWYRSTKRQVTYNKATADAINAGKQKVDGFFSAAWKERPFELFFLYTAGRDLYFDLYDWATGKSNKPGKHADAAPVPHSGGAVIADVAPAPKPVLAVSNHPGVEVADAAPQGKMIASSIEHKAPTKPAAPAANHAAVVAASHAEHSGAQHAV